jgi:hypothetical protein
MQEIAEQSRMAKGSVYRRRARPFMVNALLLYELMAAIERYFDG